MGTMEELFESLQQAALNGDTAMLQSIQNKMMLAGRNTKFDEELMSSVSDKALGKSLRQIASDTNFEKSQHWYAKTMASLLTHIIIESEKTGNSLDDYGARKAYAILGKYLNGDGDNAAREFTEFVKDHYATFLQKV